MTTLEIKDDQLTALNGRVLLITGGSSGIGLATVELFHSFGAKIVVGDMNPVPDSSPARNAIEFIRTDVTKWKDLLNLFSKAMAKYGVIDMVFANAGVAPRADYLEDKFDENGDLEEPTSFVFEVNLRACINTVKVAVHYLRSQEQGGSIVVTASSSSFQRFAGSDYSIAKHGVLGLMRAFYHPLQKLPVKITINGIAPSWTETGLVPREVMDKAGFTNVLQKPTVVARSVALLLVDKSRHGELIYSEAGKYVELEASLLRASDAGMAAAGHTISDEEVREGLMNALLSS